MDSIYFDMKTVEENRRCCYYRNGHKVSRASISLFLLCVGMKSTFIADGTELSANTFVAIHAVGTGPFSIGL